MENRLIDLDKKPTKGFGTHDGLDLGISGFSGSLPKRSHYSKIM